MTAKEDELERTKGDWSSHDNKGYRGKLDRIYVSLGEHWEVTYYIDHWLQTRGYAVNNKGRDVVAGALEHVPSSAPHMRTDLDAFLDRKFSATAK